MFCQENEKLLMQLNGGDAFRQQSSVWDWNVGYQLALLLVCKAPFCKKHAEPKKKVHKSTLNQECLYP